MDGSDQGRELRVACALRWLAERRARAPEANPGELVAETALRFGLSPVEEECLIRAVWPAPAEGASHGTDG